ncbi:MAG TPA: GntR family transcriptional regulator [Isosphaeraceae bacterium]|jgi:GntR family transcriptional regulator|nr:GntR family transcriptional regulator [Isosphaeraceae bacterium]
MFRIDEGDPTPLYAQLERAIRAAIATGRLRTNDQLPTVRQLAVDLRVNANTVAKVYSELERAGVVATRRGVGTFVLASESELRPGEGHIREFEALANRFLAEASGLGFSIDEVIQHLQNSRTDGRAAEARSRLVQERDHGLQAKHKPGRASDGWKEG